MKQYNPEKFRQYLRAADLYSQPQHIHEKKMVPKMSFSLGKDFERILKKCKKIVL